MIKIAPKVRERTTTKKVGYQVFGAIDIKLDMYDTGFHDSSNLI